MSTEDPKHDTADDLPIPPREPPPGDPWAVRMAVAAIGVALVAFLIGAALIAANGKPVPTQYWSTGSAISGALLGILAPQPTQQTDRPAKSTPRLKKAWRELLALVADVWKNRQLLILLIVFGVSAGLAVRDSSAPTETVAAAAGGALIGLIAPNSTSSKGT